jgi:carboxylesterase
VKDQSFYLPSSEEKGVLLVHGLTGAPSEMRFVGKHLNKMGFSVYAPTLAGHCLDEAALLATTYEDWVESLRLALVDLKSRVRTVSAAGICVGGTLALHLAHQEKGQIDKVAIYAAALNYDGWNQPLWSRAARIFKDVLIRLPAVRRARFQEAHPFGVKDDRIRKIITASLESQEGGLPYFPASALYQNYRLNDVLEKELPDITVPTLLLHAKEDDISHPRNSYAIQKKHGGECKVELLEDSYHLIHVDRERHKVAQMTGDFFGSPPV